MPNEEHLARLRRGVKAWNRWRAVYPEIQPHLSRADLTKALLTKVDLRRADLIGADLTAAMLTGADLNRADLARACLARADLIGTDFTRACLNGAQLFRASVGETIFGNTDLSVARGLDKVWHRGPSTIGVDTLYRSHGKIPKVFLRCAGVPRDFIPYIASLVGHPFEFYSCFISYNHTDKSFARRL